MVTNPRGPADATATHMTAAHGAGPSEPSEASRRGRPPAADALPTARSTLVRVAAVADTHLHKASPRRFGNAFRQAARHADMLLIGGDLTESGTEQEARLVAEDLAGIDAPTAVVLGNHDYHAGQVDKLTGILTDAGVHVLEGSGTVITCRGVRVGIAGCKGYGGGFGPVVHEHGEPQTRAFVRHSRISARRLATALRQLDQQKCDLKLALTHYAPTAETLRGEPPELYLVLGSELLGRVIDDAGVTLAIHGHAHKGRERGTTPGGVPVRNVAYRVLGTAYRIYTLRASSAEPTSWRVFDESGPDAARQPGTTPSLVGLRVPHRRNPTSKGG